MIRIAILGDIGSGKSFIAKNFGYPVFNADDEVSKIYKKNKKVYKKLKKTLPKYFNSFPIKKTNVLNAILDNKNNLKKIIKIIHSQVRLEMKIFLNKNRHKKIVILDIPLLLENKINKKKDYLIFIQAQKSKILKRLKKRKNYNGKLYNILRKSQISINIKKKKSDFIIRNNFDNISFKKDIRYILKKIL